MNDIIRKIDFSLLKSKVYTHLQSVCVCVWDDCSANCG